MIHDYPRIRNYIAGFVELLKNNFNENIALLSVILTILILSIFIVSSLIEYLRLSLYNSIFNKIKDSFKIREYKSKLITFANRVGGSANF